VESGVLLLPPAAASRYLLLLLPAAAARHLLLLTMKW
jgi:hypothetical protein